MTDTEKVALCGEILEDFWGAYADEGAEALTVALNCIGTVLDFKTKEDNNG